MLLLQAALISGGPSLMLTAMSSPCALVPVGLIHMDYRSGFSQPLASAWGVTEQHWRTLDRGQRARSWFSFSQQLPPMALWADIWHFTEGHPCLNLCQGVPPVCSEPWHRYPPDMIFRTTTTAVSVDFKVQFSDISFDFCQSISWSFPDGSVVKNPPAKAGDTRLIPGSGRSSRAGNTLQYSCLENPRDRGAWWDTVHGVAKSRTWMSNWACHSQYLCYLGPVTCPLRASSSWGS